MFSLERIQEAHSKVKSGADFPQYIRDIKDLGVVGYTTYVADGITEFVGKNSSLKSNPKHSILPISNKSESDRFCQYLKLHQQGQSDYLTFCKQAAETGIEKWTVLLDKMTCTYYDKMGTIILVENVPG